MLLRKITLINSLVADLEREGIKNLKLPPKNHPRGPLLLLGNFKERILKTKKIKIFAHQIGEELLSGLFGGIRVEKTVHFSAVAMKIKIKEDPLLLQKRLNQIPEFPGLWMALLWLLIFSIQIVARVTDSIIAQNHPINIQHWNQDQMGLPKQLKGLFLSSE